MAASGRPQGRMLSSVGREKMKSKTPAWPTVFLHHTLNGGGKTAASQWADTDCRVPYPVTRGVSVTAACVS